MKTVNPFDDPEIRRQLLEKERSNGGSEHKQQVSEEVVQAEVVDEYSELKNIITSTPKIPSQVKNVILDASAIVKNEKEAKVMEMTKSMNEIFSKFNKEYKTDIHIDFSSLSRTLVNVADPESRKTLELFVSELFQSVRPILIIHMIGKLWLAIEYILDEKRLFDPNSFSLADSFVAVEKIMQFIGQLEEMRNDIVIKGSDLELKRRAEEKINSVSNDPAQRKVIEDFMTLFNKDQGIGD